MNAGLGVNSAQFRVTRGVAGGCRSLRPDASGCRESDCRVLKSPSKLNWCQPYDRVGAARTLIASASAIESWRRSFGCAHPPTTRGPASQTSTVFIMDAATKAVSHEFVPSDSLAFILQDAGFSRRTIEVGMTRSRSM